MHTTIPLILPHSSRLPGARALASAALLAAALCAPQGLAAQVPAAPSTPVHRAVHAHKRPAAAAQPEPAPQPEPAAVEPPKPEIPAWPANEKPALAAITWDSHGLRIDAANSSLHQILKDVATATGAKVEGLGSDERVFGAYGPGQVRDVISELLRGSGYNVIMIGDQGQGAPRQILLSSSHGGAEAPQAASGDQPAGGGGGDEDADIEEQPQPQPQMPVIRPGFAPGGPPRSPQQIMQEMQMRQQQLQQMQHQQPQ
jgi:hypothetical protein